MKCAHTYLSSYTRIVIWLISKTDPGKIKWVTSTRRYKTIQTIKESYLQEKAENNTDNWVLFSIEIIGNKRAVKCQSLGLGTSEISIYTMK